MVYDVTTNNMHFHDYCVKKGKYFKSTCVVKIKSQIANINQFVLQT